MEWKTSKTLVEYPDALGVMNARVDAIRQSDMEELVWLLEHPSLYTAGTSADEQDLISQDFPVYETGRGGQYTYHGPGQRVAYVMLDLRKRQNTPDIKKYVWQLEEWIIRTLADFGVKGERRCGRVGIWVDLEPFGGIKGQESKIAAIGVRIRRWVTLHGIAINLNPDLNHFGGIVPCGISEHGVTSLADLGIEVTKDQLDERLKVNFHDVFDADLSAQHQQSCQSA